MITTTIIHTYPLKRLISKKLTLLEMNIDNKLSFAHELYININQKFCLFKLKTLALLHFLSEHFKIAFNRRFIPFECAK